MAVSVCCTIILCGIITVPVLCCPGTIHVFATTLQGGLAAITSWLRLELVVDTDRRVNLMSEILSAIRLIKMYGWEDSFRAKVQTERRDSRKIPLSVEATSLIIFPLIYSVRMF